MGHFGASPDDFEPRRSSAEVNAIAHSEFWDLGFGIYLGFGLWNLDIKTFVIDSSFEFRHSSFSND
jgi:hypothetical protein